MVVIATPVVVLFAVGANVVMQQRLTRDINGVMRITSVLLRTQAMIETIVIARESNAASLRAGTVDFDSRALGEAITADLRFIAAAVKPISECRAPLERLRKALDEAESVVARASLLASGFVG